MTTIPETHVLPKSPNLQDATPSCNTGDYSPIDIDDDDGFTYVMDQKKRREVIKKLAAKMVDGITSLLNKVPTGMTGKYL